MGTNPPENTEWMEVTQDTPFFSTDDQEERAVDLFDGKTDFRLCGAGIVFFRSIKDDSVRAVLKGLACLGGWGIGKLCVLETRFRGEASSELIQNRGLGLRNARCLAVWPDPDP